MQEHRDLRDMMEVLGIAIVREEAEEDFFRRSAKASTSKVAVDLYLEIAEEFAKQKQSLEARKQKLEIALSDLIKAKKE